MLSCFDADQDDQFRAIEAVTNLFSSQLASDFQQGGEMRSEIKNKSVTFPVRDPNFSPETESWLKSKN